MPDTRLSALHHIDLVDGRFAQTTPAQLKELFDAVEAHDARDHLLLYFHGGLVPRKTAHRIGLHIAPIALEAGAYPVFVVWNSDLFHAIGANLDEIAKEKVFRRLLRRVGQLVMGKLKDVGGGRGGPMELESLKNIPQEPEDLQQWMDAQEEALKGAVREESELTPQQEAQVERELESDIVLKSETQRIANGMRSEAEIEADRGSRGTGALLGSTETRMSADIVEEIRAAAPAPEERGLTTLLVVARYGLRIVKAVLKRFRNGRDHGVYTTIVEEILRTLYLDNAGALVWNTMKKDTADAFDAANPDSGGSALVKHLEAWWKPGRRITCVGHSTGAIYIGHLLEAVDPVLPAGAKLDVVFFAGAASFPFFHERIDAAKRRVGGLRSFALADSAERSYWEVPGLYRGSLLYLVAGLFEADEVDMPIVGMERYFRATGPYDRADVRSVLELIPQEDRVWAGDGRDLGDGRRSAAPKHGAFDEDVSTLDSLKHLLANGF